MPLTYEPHYDADHRADQVQIYEPILGDRGNSPDDGAAHGDAIPEGQPAAAARIRQGNGRRGDRCLRFSRAGSGFLAPPAIASGTP